MNVFSQEKNIEHTVSKGETISEIAKYYNVKPSEIYDLNPEARKGIKYKAVLLIPVKAKKNTAVSAKGEKNPAAVHEVLPKETLYGIAKQYNTTINDLYKINPDLENQGLKIGQVIYVPSTGAESLVSAVKPENKTEIKKSNVSKAENTVVSKTEENKELSAEGIVYEILPKESLYSIAKKHGIALAELQKVNPELEHKTLRPGQKIIVPVKEGITDANLSETKTAEEKTNKKTDTSSKNIVEENKPLIEFVHEVLSKETKYGIARQYGLTVAELEKQNPDIIKRLPIGYKLKIRSSKTIEIKAVADETPAVKEESDKTPVADNTFKVYDAALVDKLISTASENLGTRYRSGGTTKDGFDCSGLMYSTFSLHDIKLPRSSFEMASYGSKIDTEKAQRGDLIFFKTNGRGRINHVGMIIEVLEGEIKFIHSSTSSGVIISSTKESYYERSFAQVNRVL